MTGIRSKLTYANVMATIAVFVALGGSGYAAATISGSDIKNRSIAGKKLKSRTIAGRNIKRNTVTGASTAQLAVLLVDARKGVVEQTRRHAAVLALLGVPRLVLAVNKIDLVGYGEAAFEVIAQDFTEHATALGYPLGSVLAIPVSALLGDNVVERSAHTPWYRGPTLLEYLETVPVEPDPHDLPFRFPVQYVIRPRTAEYPDYRGYAGQVVAGTIAAGDEVVVLPAGLRTRVSRIDTPDGPLTEATAGRSVTRCRSRAPSSRVWTP